MTVSDRLAALVPQWTRHAASAGAADAVHATLREAIISGMLLPGDSLIEEQIARVFGVSRTPVREALLRLGAEDLAKRIARRGLVVRTISDLEVLEVYTLRTVLDSLAARLASSEAQPREIAHLRWLNHELADAVERGDVTRQDELNKDFHLSLARAAHSGMLLQFIQQMFDWLKRFGPTTFAYPGRAAVGLEEHCMLVMAIEAHDAETAEAITRKHMAAAQEIRVEMLRQKAADGANEQPA